QYCYSHLLREVQDLGKEFPDHQEVQDFVGTTAPLLAQAMQLRTLPISDKVFYERADQLKMDIQQVMHSAARHAGIQKIQNIFRENAHRMYHWAHDRAIPADNNFAEREFRKLVIARKISFGSQGDAGAKTREILMTTLLTLKKRKPGDVRANFKACLDALARDPKHDPYHVLFSLDSS
ncbi:MAG: transposase, partial [candidate division KSB1 bacterium]|nr:transposase [candidate division KSB1 bacterium]